jgi:hypothetical protein
VRVTILRLESTTRETALPRDVRDALARQGFIVYQAIHIESGWLLEGAFTTRNGLSALEVPAGWRVADTWNVMGRASWCAPQVIGDLLTYALLLWPAIVVSLSTGEGDEQVWARITATVWLGLLHLVAYRTRHGAYFGNSMLMLSACVAGFWYSHPGPWMFLWFVLILVGLLAAVRGGTSSFKWKKAAAGLAGQATPPEVDVSGT